MISEIKQMTDIIKKILDSKLAWDLFQTPIYNRVVSPTSKRIVEDVLDSIEKAKGLSADGFRALDVGCGSGLATRTAARRYRNISIIGVDYSASQIKAANRDLARDPLRNCRFRTGNAMNLPFEDNSFNMVVSVASFKHWRDGTKGLREILRVLKPRSKAIIGEVDRDYDYKDMERFCRSLNHTRLINKKLFEFHMKRTVFGKSYSRAEAQACAYRAGFTDVTVEKLRGWPVFIMALTSP